MSNWIDYYRVLQVAYNAEPIVIESTYKRLCKIYHPDINRSPDAVRRMQEINAAYSVLGDARKRNAYYLEWVGHNRKTAGSSAKQEPKKPQGSPRAAQTSDSRQYSYKQGPKSDAEAADDVMTHYFLSLCAGQYRDAYYMLCSQDRNSIKFEAFEQWQRAVSEVYRIRSFKTRAPKAVEKSPISPKSMDKALRFVIEIVEENMFSRKTNRYSFTKVAVCEQQGWRVYLGYKDLAKVMEKFKTTHNPSAEKYTMPDLEGFCKRAEPECYRYKRHKRDFVLGVIRINILREGLGQVLTEKIIAQGGSVIAKSLRLIDSFAYIGNGFFAVLLSEARMNSAKSIIARLFRQTEQDVWKCFDSKISIHCELRQYEGGDIKRNVQACLNSLDK